MPHTGKTEDDAATALLRERDRQLADAQALAGLGSWEWDLAQPTLTFSDEFCRLVGRPAGFAPSYWEFVELIHPDDRQSAAPNLEDLQSGGVQTIDYRILRSDGAVRFVTARRHARCNAAGEITHVVGTVQDVTERRELERERRVAQERFERAFDDASMGMALVDLDLRYMRVNRALCAIVGYSADELTALTVNDVSHPEDGDSGPAALQRIAMGNGRSFQIEKRYLHRDGHVVWVKASVSLVRDESGEPLHLVAQIEDITERRAMLEALRESERRFDSIAANLPGMVYRFAMSPEGEFSLPFASHRARDLYGVDAEALMADVTLATGAMHPDDAERYARSVAESAEHLTRWDWHGRHVMPDGTVKYLYGTAQPHRDPDGTVIWDGVILDETEVHLAREHDAQTERRLQLMLDNLPGSAIAVYDRELRIRFCQGPLVADLDLATLVGQRLVDFVPADVFQQLAPGIMAALDGAATTVVIERDRLGRPLAVSLVPYRLADGTIDGALAHLQDITDLRSAQSAALVAEERRRAFDVAPIGMALISREGLIEQANDALGVITGRSHRELEGLSLTELMHPAELETVQRTLSALARNEGGSMATESRLVGGDGPVDVIMHGAVLRDAEGRATHLLCQFIDVTERKRYESQLQFMADHDPLTGLLNRRKFEAELDRHMAHSKRYGAQGALLAVDLDNFKQVNDTLGHSAGDELITSIAGVLRGRMRETDILARLGGDEFAVLLPEADEAEAARVAQAILHAVRTKAHSFEGVPGQVTASVGVTTVKQAAAASSDALMVEADVAMYDAKQAGRGCYAFYSSSEHDVGHNQTRLEWVDRIKNALDLDRFVLAAQPIRDLHTGQVLQHELLIRMLDEQDELIQPATFLYIAERFGLMSRVDQWVTSHAIDLLERRPELHLEVNISGRSLGDPMLLEAIEHRLSTSLADPSHLIFEVTETSAVANVPQAQAFAQRLRDQGCRFALDDFGAGFGSFYYLKHLPFHYVKIDGEFVQHSVESEIDRLVIEAVVNIATGLGKKTIAEFVGDAETERMITQLGVDYAQGYYIGRPVPIADLFALNEG